MGKPLVCVVNVATKKGGGGRETFRVKYEKPPHFCAVCGILGHVDTKCGDGVHGKKNYSMECG